MRRAIYHGREHLGHTEPFFYRVCDLVVEQMRDAYPELETQRDFIGKMVRMEEERFGNTMIVGLEHLNNLDLSQPDNGELFTNIAKLYDTYGTPRDLIRVFLEEKGVEFEEEDFNSRFDEALHNLQQQSTVGHTTRKSEISPVYAAVLEKTGANRFHGYETTRLDDARVVAILNGDKELAELGEGEQGGVVLDNTPFYAESGGQVGDAGVIVGRASSPPYEGGVASASDDGVVLSDANELTPLEIKINTENHPVGETPTPLLRKEGSFKASVHDTFSPVAGLIIHKVTVEKGSLKIGDAVSATVDAPRRDATRRNHTATHLLHAALKEVLGSHVKQAGSVVAPNYLRFDFTHYQPMTAAEIEEIEDLVNRYILENHPVNTNLMSIEEAMRSGAVALFGEKYVSDVRVLSVGDGVFSKELCGGTHVRATGDIGAFKIMSDEAIASGVRRIRAITGFDSFARLREDERLIDRSLEALKTQRDNLPDAIEKLQEELKRIRREMDDLKLKIATGSVGSGSGGSDDIREIKGVKVMGKIVEGLDANGMRQLSDTLLARIKSGIVVLGRAEAEKTGIIVRVSDDLTGRIKAGNIIKEIVPIVGGRGGGKPDMAEGGGNIPDKLSEAIDAAYQFIETNLN
jgi:alanyl-tRNA synthetase